MQPYFFPYLGYWQLINAVDSYVIFDDVNYIKRGWINRNKILYNDEPKHINIYLKGISQNKLINEIEIGDKNKNDNNLIIIRDAYRKAPYFDKLYPILERINNCNAANVARYNGYAIETICKYLDIQTELIYSSDLNNDKSLRGEEKIIDICQLLGADVYINAIGGKELYHKENFEKKGLELRFLQMKDISYMQFGEQFVPGLSIIDVLMFNSVDEVKRLLREYTILG